MEIDFSVSSGEPVYANAERITLRVQVYRPDHVLFRAWDFGNPAGTQHNDKSAATSIGILATKAITVRHRKTLVNEGLEIVQWLISQG